MSEHDRLHRLFGPAPLECRYCQVSLNCPCLYGSKVPSAYTDLATLDHIVPKSRGGSNAPENLAEACHHCNTSKNNRIWPDEWIPDRNHNTAVRGCLIVPEPGDSLARRGLIALLGELPSGRLYGLNELSAMTGTAASVIRNELERLETTGRISRLVRRGFGSSIYHEYATEDLEVAA